MLILRQGNNFVYDTLQNVGCADDRKRIKYRIYHDAHQISYHDALRTSAHPTPLHCKR